MQLSDWRVIPDCVGAIFGTAPCKFQLLISVISRCDDGLLSSHLSLSLFLPSLSSALSFSPFQFGFIFRAPQQRDFCFVLSGVDEYRHISETRARLIFWCNWRKLKWYDLVYTPYDLPLLLFIADKLRFIHHSWQSGQRRLNLNLFYSIATESAYSKDRNVPYAVRLTCNSCHWFRTEGRKPRLESWISLWFLSPLIVSSTW